MSYYDEADVRKLIDLLQLAKINVVTTPSINSVMQGRFDSWPKGRGITRVKNLHHAGITVAVAHDDFSVLFIRLAHMTGAEFRRGF